MKRIILLSFAISCTIGASAQVGGRHIYDFLNLVPSARIGALGGVNVSILDDDVHFGSQNPALVNPEMHQRLVASYSPYLAGIKYGYTGYSHTVEGIGSFHSAIQYMNTGQMQGADEFGNFTQTFSAQELVWMIGGSRSWGQFRYGSNVKVISSTLAPGFGSWGLAADLGGSFRSKDSLFSAGLVLRNLGFQLSTYTATGSREP
ncbi:MAG: PorV/PorQ family protein, partial [Bacteroidota bacterium]